MLPFWWRLSGTAISRQYTFKQYVGIFQSNQLAIEIQAVGGIQLNVALPMVAVQDSHRRAIDIDAVGGNTAECYPSYGSRPGQPSAGNRH
jgi:hypothetical protein